MGSAGQAVSRGNRGGGWIGTGGGAWTWSWTRSGGSAPGSRRTPCRSHPASWAGRRSARTAWTPRRPRARTACRGSSAAGRLTGLDRLGILDQVAELAVAVLAQRDVQRDRLPGVLLHLDKLLRGHVQPGRAL